MSDPPRLVSPESGAGDFERRMLRAWSEERPAPGARDATLAALGLGPAGRSAMAMAKIAKWTLLLLGLGASAVVVVDRQHAPSGSAVIRFESPSRDHTPVPTLSVVLAPEPAGSTSTSSAGVPIRRRAAASPDTLQAEITALDAARAALREGDPTSACQILDRYDAAFPHGTLREEAGALRIEALIAAGDRAEAQRRTDAFALSHPASPHLGHLRRLLESRPRAIP